MKTLAVILLAGVIISQSIAQDRSRVRVSGVVFFDYFYDVSRDSLLGTLPDVVTPGAKDFNGFQIRRVYFTYDHDVSANFMIRFRLEADGSTVTPNSKMTVA